MPGLPLQPPGDTPCTLRLGALAAAAAAALAAAARAAFLALPSRASHSGWAKRRGGGGGTPVSLSLEISFCFPRRLTRPLPFLRKGDLFSGTGKNIFLRRGGWVAASGAAASLLSSPSPPPSEPKSKPHNCSSILLPFLHLPSFPPLPVSPSPFLIISLLCFPLWGVSSLSGRSEAVASPGSIS